ncbi:hypothetical protein MASR1M31_06710 [Porphyromonadaceae bacterium]
MVLRQVFRKCDSYITPNEIHNKTIKIKIMKCMKNNFLVFTLLCCSFSLLAQNKPPTVSINPKGMETAKTRLSDLIQSIEYIPLETNESSLIANIRLFDISSKHIVLWTYPTQDVLLFQRTGEFVSKIATRGLGPEEYYSVPQLSINEERQEIDLICLSPDKRIKKSYNFRGRFLRMTHGEKSLITFLRKIDHLWLFMDLRSDSVRNEYIVYDFDKHKTVTTAVRSNPIQWRGQGGTETGAAIHYLRNGMVHLRNSYRNDTLYQIKKDYRFIPYYSFDVGKYKMPDEVRTDIQKFLKRTPEYVFIRSLYETGSDFLFSYEYENRKWYAIYNKTTRQSALFPSEKGIPNDWDGGPDIWFTRQDEKTMYGFIPASEFLEHKNKLTPKGPQSAIKRMNELKDTLLEDDNPVFVVVTMK